MGGEKFGRWSQITIQELQAYMGFMVLMGIVHLPSIYDYWKKDPIFHYAPIASRISRDRFFELHRYLHFADNSCLHPPGHPQYDKVGKVKPILTRLAQIFRTVYTPQMSVSVDEAMIRFKGRSTLKQYMPKKPIKRGIKVWALSDASNGYMSEFEVYTGKKGDKVEKNLGSNVVKTLTQHMAHSHRHVYFDNYFNSISLLLDLLRNGLYGCGTINANRKGLPEQLKFVARKGLQQRGDSVIYQCQQLTAMVWQDKKRVLVAATNADPTSEVQVMRKNKDGSRTAVKCPSAIALYNRYMGGVDRNDQLRGFYHVRLKCRKYYKYIFWSLFDIAITNCYILYKHFTTDHSIHDLKTFRVELAKRLIGEYSTRKRPGRPSLTQPPKKFCQAHFPVRGAERAHRCHYCHAYKNQRRETVWYCRDCSHFLCHNGREDDCFLLFHTHHVPAE